MSISRNKDVERKIFSNLDDKTLLKVCSIDKYTWNTICDDTFLKMRLLEKYPKIEEYKGKKESWKKFFLRAVHDIALMKEKYNYDHTLGNFTTQYNLLQQNKDYKKLLENSVKKGELALVDWSLKNLDDSFLNIGLEIAVKNANHIEYEVGESGYLKIIKYFVERGIDIHSQEDYVFRKASEDGYLETVKFLIERGANIHSKHDEALRNASSNGHLDVVKYLVEKGADIKAYDNQALIAANENEHFEVANYLKSNM
jgi:ankyrin repeat protein